MRRRATGLAFFSRQRQPHPWAFAIGPVHRSRAELVSCRERTGSTTQAPWVNHYSECIVFRISLNRNLSATFRFQEKKNFASYLRHYENCILSNSEIKIQSEKGNVPRFECLPRCASSAIFIEQVNRKNVKVNATYMLGTS